MYHLDPEKDAAKIEELKKRFPGRKLHRLSATIDSQEIVVYARAASREEYNRFRREIADDRSKAKAIEMLTTTCIIHPAAEPWQALLSEYPGLAETFGENLLEIAGLNVKAEAKPF
jgi:hypothetical protein